MTDKELLELAAKAAGICLQWIGDNSFDCTKLKLDMPVCKGAFWMPLHDDGDALRLAVKLNLLDDPRFFHERAVLMFTKGLPRLEATRRAFVIAAAEIGKVTQ